MHTGLHNATLATRGPFGLYLRAYSLDANAPPTSNSGFASTCSADEG